MTLVLCAIDRDRALLAADRRLTVNGTLDSDEQNKLGRIVYQNGRMLFAFSGLARSDADSFVAWDWLIHEAIGPCVRYYASARSIVDHLATLATERFRELRHVRREQRQFSVVFAGYEQGLLAEPIPHVFLVSNCEELNGPVHAVSQEFSVSSLNAAKKREPVWLVARTFGHVEPSADDMEPVVNLFKDGKPKRAIIDKAVDAIRATARTRLAHNSVGEQCDVGVLPAKFELPPHVEYHSQVNNYTAYSTALVHYENREAVLCVSRMTVGFDGVLPINVPRVAAHRPCPCGSGRRYRDCHRRQLGG